MKFKKVFMFFSIATAFALAAASCSNVNEPDSPDGPGTDTTSVDTTDTVGAGTEASPYTVTGAIANQGTTKWVKGYIVGYVWSGTTTTYTFSADTCTQAKNILIADSKTETSSAKCIAVQLPSGVIRTGLNLKDVKANLGKSVVLYGSLEAYFGNPGLKSVSYYELEDGTTGGTKPVDTSNAIFSESFSESQGDFTMYDIKLPEGGSYVWKWDSSYKYMKASAYISGNQESESWLISPAISLTGKTAATLSFEHTGKHFTTNQSTEQVVLVSTDYTSGDPSTATWTALTIPTWPTGSDWTFVNSGDISLSTAVGNANVHIAFKYVSTTSGAAAWEIKNVVVQ